MEILLTVAIIVITAVLLWVVNWRMRQGQKFALRPLPAYKALEGHVGRAIESASKLHISLGRASLIGTSNPTSVAALSVLEKMAIDGGANGTPPLVTVGEGTLLPIAQEELRYAYLQADQRRSFEKGLAQFVANENDPYAYAGGVAAAIQQNKIVSNVLVGKFGPEIGIMLEAASRQDMSQIVGSNDPAALALATAVTDNLLIGEELLAANAYLEGTQTQIASLVVQDILRLLAIVGIIGFALYQLVGQ